MNSARPTPTSFLRDVGMNVVTNIVAAALIYSLGALFGIFPGMPGITALAVIIVLIGTAWVAVKLTERKANPWKRRGMTLGGSIFGAAIFCFSLMARREEPFFAVLFILIAISVWIATGLLHSIDKESSARSKWHLLSWYTPHSLERGGVVDENADREPEHRP